LMRNPKQANTQPQWDTQIEFNKATLENIKNLSDAVRFNMTSIDNNAQSIRQLMDATNQVTPYHTRSRSAG